MTGHRKVAKAVLEAGTSHVRVQEGPLRVGLPPSGVRAPQQRASAPDADAPASIAPVVRGNTTVARDSARSAATAAGLRPVQPCPVRIRMPVGRGRACRSRDRPALS